MQRFFIKLQDVNNSTILFDEAQSKKIRKVLRMKSGDKVLAFDGKGWEYEVELSKITNDYSVGGVVNQTLHEPETDIVICQALPKNLKVEFVLQKCTELGVDRIILFESEFSQIDSTKISEERMKRFRRISQEAAEQCGRVFTPSIEVYHKGLYDLIENIKSDETLKSFPVAFLDKKGEFITEKPELHTKNIIFFVGPEGGFSAKELELLSKSEFTKIKIGQNTLRSETAGAAFLSQIQPYL